MSKDPFQILADELTLIRHDMEKLQRTSLDKQEAEDLHSFLAEAVEKMHAETLKAPQALRSALKADRDQMAREATQAATAAAERVLEGVRTELGQERLKFAQAAGEARRAAWRSFGGFWVWLASVGAAGALLGALAAFWITGRGDAREFGRFPSIYCDIAGGQEGTNEGGNTGCVFWYD